MVSSLGVGTDAHMPAALGKAEPVIDAETFAPFLVHPLSEVEWATQISKRDQRQMEQWQRTGTFAAGLALEDAGISTDDPLRSAIDMTVAAAGGERDVEVDEHILQTMADGANDAQTLVNEKLSTDLRPTLFLAQLSNLLAGNISIVHKVTGSSRTFMGEEGAGLSAIQNSVARIKTGQSDIALVGASYNGQHWDTILTNEALAKVARGTFKPVFDRTDGGDESGLVPGSGGAFLVLEEMEHAKARDAKIYAIITDAVSDQGLDERFDKRMTALADYANLEGAACIISTASGAPARTAAEKAFLDTLNKPYRETTSTIGFMREVQSIMASALTALAMDAGQTPFGMEVDHDGPTAVLCVGHLSAEGVILIEGAPR